MGLGPKQTSLLRKLGKLQAWEMSSEQLQKIVADNQQKRTIDRSMSRAAKLMSSSTTSLKRSKARSKEKASNKPLKKLEDCGLSVEIVKSLRATGKQDFQIILELQAAGLI